MRLNTLTVSSYSIPLMNNQMRSGVLIHITDDQGRGSLGEIAPFRRSQETGVEAIHQVVAKRDEIVAIDWTEQNCFHELAKLTLFPSVSFGLESALLALLLPLPDYAVSASALFMGTPTEILEQAKQRYVEGYTSAKIKVSNLDFREAAYVIRQLKDRFRLRIDVNRVWNTLDSLQFFSQFPLDTFDFVEEPFQDPNDLEQFPHPLAVDESFPQDLSIEQLERLPTLKAVVYKPTIQGGLLQGLPLHRWATKRGVMFVPSSSFEADLGLAHVAAMAHRLAVTAPIAIGAYHHFKEHLCVESFRFSDGKMHIPAQLTICTR